MRHFEVSDRPETGTELVLHRSRVSPDLRQMLEFTLMGEFAKRVQEQVRVISVWELFAWDIGPEVLRGPLPHAPTTRNKIEFECCYMAIRPLHPDVPTGVGVRSSLRLEWRLRAGLIQCSVPGDQMHFRRLDDLDIAGRLADLAVSHGEESRHDHGLQTAVRLLAAGERGLLAAAPS